jgi:hypothetical protein
VPIYLETHHAFGPIGYADEHEAPMHFKRVHLDAIALGGSARSTRLWLRPCWRTFTSLADSPDGT